MKVQRKVCARTIFLAIGMFASSTAFAFTAKDAASLFERVRADMPCMKTAATHAKEFGLKKTNGGENSLAYTTFEYADRARNVFLLKSYEIQDGQPQTAASVSVYASGEDFAPELTNAFADIWNLPVPVPLRTDPNVAQFEWLISFPNGDMQIVLSYSPDSRMTQIYGRTLGLTKEQFSVCSKQ